MARNIYGLDLGTYEIKVFDKKENRIWREKNVIAVKDKKYIFSTGNAAYEMYEKSPDNIQVYFPMKDGVIARFDDMQYLLGQLLGTYRQFSRGSEYVVAVPTDVTEVEKKAFYDLVLHSEAKAKAVRIVERGLADALGLGLDVMNEKGIFIANFGGGTTELSVLSYGGIVLNRLVKIGGEHLDMAISGLVRHKKDFLIGRLTAEKLRREFGVLGGDTKEQLTVSGRDLILGVPSHGDISRELVRSAINDQILECVRAIRSLIERTPPDVRRVIEKKGIYLTGGVSQMKGLSSFLEQTFSLPVITAPDPAVCAVEGVRKIVQNKEYYKKLTYSMLDEDYRWLR